MTDYLIKLERPCTLLVSGYRISDYRAAGWEDFHIEIALSESSGVNDLPVGDMMNFDYRYITTKELAASGVSPIIRRQIHAAHIFAGKYELEGKKRWFFADSYKEVEAFLVLRSIVPGQAWNCTRQFGAKR